jgi:anti-sigma factor RsiW
MSQTPHDHKQCRALFEKLSEYLDNELDSAAAQAIKAHLDACKPCQVCVATLKRTVSLCRAVGNTPVPEDLSRRLLELIQRYR